MVSRREPLCREAAYSGLSACYSTVSFAGTRGTCRMELSVDLVAAARGCSPDSPNLPYTLRHDHPPRQ
jgi:hypothetical protein